LGKRATGKGLHPGEQLPASSSPAPLDAASLVQLTLSPSARQHPPGPD